MCAAAGKEAGLNEDSAYLRGREKTRQIQIIVVMVTSSSLVRCPPITCVLGQQAYQTGQSVYKHAVISEMPFVHYCGKR